MADYIGRSHEAALTVIRRDRGRRRVLTILALLVFVAGLGLAVFGWKMYQTASLRTHRDCGIRWISHQEVSSMSGSSMV